MPCATQETKGHRPGIANLLIGDPGKNNRPIPKTGTGRNYCADNAAYFISVIFFAAVKAFVSSR